MNKEWITLKYDAFFLGILHPLLTYNFLCDDIYN